MDHKRTTGWGLTRNEAALLGAIIGYGILVVVVTPLLLGFLPHPRGRLDAPGPRGLSSGRQRDLAIDAGEPLNPVANPTESAGSPASTERRTVIGSEAS